MIRLIPDNGIPRRILLMMATMAGFTVANLYYNQPLLDVICRETGITQVQANLITVFTQIGYALGLLFVVPIADMVSLRRIVMTCMSVAALSAVAIGQADNVWLLWGASLTLGLSSIMPQLFIPMATRYSRPENKTRNMGYVASGLVTGIVSARAVSGVGKYVPRVGTLRMSIVGGCLQIMAWMSAWLWGDSYTGLIVAIIFADSESMPISWASSWLWNSNPSPSLPKSIPVNRNKSKVGTPKRYPHLLMTMLAKMSTAPRKKMFSGVNVI